MDEHNNNLVSETKLGHHATYIFIITGAVVLIFLVGGAILLQRTPKVTNDEAQVSTSPINVASSTEVSDGYVIPTGWKEYENTTYGIAFHYPPIYTVQELHGSEASDIKINFTLTDEAELKKFDAELSAQERTYYKDVRDKVPVTVSIPLKEGIGFGNYFSGSSGTYDVNTRSVLLAEAKLSSDTHMYRFLCPKERVGPDALPGFLAGFGDGGFSSSEIFVMTNRNYAVKIKKIEEDVPTAVNRRGAEMFQAILKTLRLTQGVEAEKILCTTSELFKDFGFPALPRIEHVDTQEIPVTGSNPVTLTLSEPLPDDITVRAFLIHESNATYYDLFNYALPAPDEPRLQVSTIENKLRITPVGAGGTWENMLEKKYGTVQILFFRTYRGQQIILDESFTDTARETIQYAFSVSSTTK